MIGAYPSLLKASIGRCLSFAQAISGQDKSNSCTRRALLSCTASLFDSTGVLADWQYVGVSLARCLVGSLLVGDSPNVSFLDGPEQRDQVEQWLL